MLTTTVDILGFILPMGADVTVLVWLSLTNYIAIFEPAIVVPVLIMILFKAIWSAVKGLLMCRARGEVSTGHTAENQEVPSTASTEANTGPQP